MRRSSLRGLVLAIAWGIAAGPAGAQSSPPDAVPSFSDERLWSEEGAPASGELPPDLEPNAPIVESGQPLSLDEAVALSLRNNLDLEIQRFAPLIAESARDGAWGAYDPVLNADARYDVQKNPNNFLTLFNPILVNRDRVEGGGVGIDQKVPWLIPNSFR